MTPNYYDIRQVQNDCIDLNLNDIVTMNGTQYVVKEKTLEATIDAPVIVKYQLQELGYPEYRYDPVPNALIFNKPRNIELRQFATRPHFGDFSNTVKKEKKPPKEISEETRQEFMKLLE